MSKNPLFILLFSLMVNYSIHGQNISNNLFEKKITVTNSLAETIRSKIIVYPGLKEIKSNKNNQIMCQLGDSLYISSSGYNSVFVIVKDSLPLHVVLTPTTYVLEEISIIGSRANFRRTDLTQSLPIERVSIKELNTTGQADLPEMLQFIVPSFNSNRTVLNSIANYASPATLKGLAPDQTLVLINGKRRHQFSTINNAITVGKGTVATDLNPIPAIALENVEILKEGAAAQYGSDAIAGIINLNLKKSTGKWQIKYQTSITSVGDGAINSFGINYGFKLGKKGGLLNLSSFLLYQNSTQRADNYTGYIYSKNQQIEDSLRAVRNVFPLTNNFKINRFGNNGIKSGVGFYNLEIPIKKLILYNFGGYSHRYITAFGFYRNADPTDGTTNISIYPNGYMPTLPGLTKDISNVLGLKFKNKRQWTFDISTSFGQNILDFYNFNSSNPSLGALSPQNFYLGRFLFNQITSEFNVSKFYHHWGFIKNFNLAFGGQHRYEFFRIKHGDTASFVAGPLAISQNKAIGSSGRPGISYDNETTAARTNIGLYIDVEGELVKNWLNSIAWRYENYNDFGNNFSFKLSSLYQLNSVWGLRASINKGFRAPSLQQIYNSQTSSTAQAGAIRLTENIRSKDPRLIQLGLKYPQAEISYNYNLGLTLNTIHNLYGSVDFYLIDIYNRIAVSEILFVKQIPALDKLFTNQNEITFFTNQINSSTLGVDAILNYKVLLAKNKWLQFNISYTHNQTKVTKVKPTPAPFYNGLPSTTKINLFDTLSIGLIESAQPKDRFSLTANLTLKKFSFQIRNTYFGSVLAFEKLANTPVKSQWFSPKNLVDLMGNYSLKKHVTIQLGINNLFNVYPDKVDPSFRAYNNGQVPYSRYNYQIGFAGTVFYCQCTLIL